VVVEIISWGDDIDQRRRRVRGAIHCAAVEIIEAVSGRLLPEISATVAQETGDLVLEEE
jgi:hypothetical protein